MKINQKHLKKYLHYNPNSGVWAWLSSRRGVHPSRIAGCVSHRGYIKICIDGKKYYAHRLAFLYMTGHWVKGVDHIDSNTSNNKWENLREATQSQNLCNKKMQSNNTTGFRGVVWDKKNHKWRAQIWVNGINKVLGRFSSLEEAIRSYDSNAIKYHGLFARPNGGSKSYGQNI